MYPLMMLPGLMNDARVWEPISRALDRERPCVICPTTEEEGVEAIAAVAIKAMPAGPFCVVGFSLGGYVAMEVFRLAPKRVRGLALLATGGRSEDEQGRAFRQHMIEVTRSSSDAFENAARSFLPRVLHPEHLNNVAIVSILTDMARSVGSDGFVRQQITAMHRPDSLSTLQNVHVPALVLCGAEDQICPPSLSQEMSQQMKEAELVILERGSS